MDKRASNVTLNPYGSMVVSVGNSVAVYNTASVIQYIYSLIQYTDCIPWLIRKKYNTVSPRPAQNAYASKDALNQLNAAEGTAPMVIT